MAFLCKRCNIELDTEGGFKRHMTRIHGKYSQEDLRDAGIEPTQRDIARTLDSGNTSINDVIAGAPELESDAGSSTRGQNVRTGTRGSTREDKQRASDLTEFDSLRPQMVKRWKRRLKVPYSLWARLANDPSIALTEDELTEGAEMHIDLFRALGWLKAGKIEAIADTLMWHGATALSRSDLGQQLLNSFRAPEDEDVSKTN
jgi:hypothetical protein